MANMDVDPKKLALSLLTGALLGTVFLVCTFTVQVKQLRAGIASETGRQHAAYRDPENVDRYIQSVQKIYATIRAVSPYLSHSRAKKLAPLFKHISDQSGIPIRTCLLIAKVESDFRRVRSGEDYGMMQINQFWLDRYRVTPDHAMEDWNNLKLFARIMKELADKPLSYYHSWTPSVRARYERRLEKWASTL